MLQQIIEPLAGFAYRANFKALKLNERAVGTIFAPVQIDGDMIDVRERLIGNAHVVYERVSTRRLHCERRRRI